MEELTQYISSKKAKGLWYAVWAGMALTAAANALAHQGIFSWRYGFLFGVLLAAVATVQLSSGVSFLLRKEFVLAVIVLILFCFGLVWQRLDRTASRFDFSAYYVAGHLASEHPPGRLYYQALFPDGRISPVASASGWNEVSRHYGVSWAITFVYPPFFAVLMKPFSHLPYGTAYVLWNFFTVLLTLTSIVISASLGGIRVGIKLGLILGVGVLSYFPFLEEVVLGQVSSLLCFLCALGIWLLSRNRDWQSALCFAVATMIKITPILAVPLLVFHRKWKWLAAYVLWVVSLLCFSIWQVGWPAHEQFLHDVMPSISCGITSPLNVSIVAYVQDLFLGHVPMGFQSSLPSLACPVSKAVSFVILGAVLLRFYLYRREQSLVRHLVLLTLISLAISPVTWIHHYTIALLPFIYLWCRMRESHRDWWLLATVLVVGTNITGFAFPLAARPVTQLILAAIVPCLTIALVYLRVPSEESIAPLHGTPSREGDGYFSHT